MPRWFRPRDSDGIERLVEVFQGDAWSGGDTDAAAMIGLYRVTCEARGCPMLAVDDAAIEAIRTSMDALARRWEAVPVGGTMTLVLGEPS